MASSNTATSTIVDLGEAADDLQFTETTKPTSIPATSEAADGTTHTFTNAPPSAVDDDDENDDDKAGLLATGKSGKYNFWSVEFYQQFFDVDTSDVKDRIVAGMIPRPGKSFFNDVIKKNPDLWGPFWICTTLVVSVAVTGNLASYIQTAYSGEKNFTWHYDFGKVSAAATAVFSYAWLVPAGIYGFLWWTSQLASLTFLELICLYGYSLVVYIPVSVLWLIQYSAVQWLLAIIGAGLSGAVIVLTLLPVLKANAAKSCVGILAVIVILHVLLACGFMLYFFHTPDHQVLVPEVDSKGGTHKRSSSGAVTDMPDNAIDQEKSDADVAAGDKIQVKEGDPDQNPGNEDRNSQTVAQNQRKLSAGSDRAQKSAEEKGVAEPQAQEVKVAEKPLKGASDEKSESRNTSRSGVQV